MSLQLGLSLHLERFFRKSECSGESVVEMMQAGEHGIKFSRSSLLRKEKAVSHHVNISLMSIGYGGI
jgi:hypothetical protein